MYRELAKRSQNGVVVRLLWDATDDRVFIRYRDHRGGDAFSAEVPKSEALAAFHHPNLFRPNCIAAAA